MRCFFVRKVFVIFLLSFLVFFAGCSKKSIFNDLKSIKNEAQLREMLKPRKSFISFYQKESPSEDLDDEESYTRTNVQVEGVDEGDVVKTDGKRIYSILNNNLSIVEIGNDGEIELLKINSYYQSDVNTSDNIYFSHLYLTDKYLVAIGHQYYYPETDDKINGYSVVVYAYNLADLSIAYNYNIGGSLLTSRLINDKLYIISLNSPYEKDIDLRPWIKENKKITKIDYNQIKYINNTDYNAYTIITTVNLDDKISTDNKVFLGSGYWGNVYVSHEEIILATNIYHYSLFGKTINSYGILVTYLIDEEKGVTYGGSGYYDGYVLDQFSLDSDNGYIRIATTERISNKTTNRLYVFKRAIIDNKYSLEVVGLLDEGLGKPGEMIKSVRFNGDLATVVTYVNTDPLYTIDLSDPTKPTIKGELIVSGYSTYQHPWAEGVVLGIGYEAQGNLVQGLKLSLYDISDVNNPQEIKEPLILSNNDGWQYSEALSNHKAIMVDQEYHQFGFSMSYYKANIYQNKYVVFDVDETKDTPIAIKYEITHLNLEENNSYYQYYRYAIERAVRINDYLYAISQDVMTSHSVDDGKLVTKISLSKVDK